MEKIKFKYNNCHDLTEIDLLAKEERIDLVFVNDKKKCCM